MKKKVHIKNLASCVMRRQKVQQYSDFIIACGHSIVPSPQDSDTILVWTCSFREDVKSHSIKILQAYKHKYPDNQIIAAGCMPTIAPEEIPMGVSTIPWRNDEAKMSEVFGTGPSLSSFDNVFCEAPKKKGDYTTFNDQFIKLLIQEGCGHSCTYCSEKRAFPKYHSWPVDKLVAAAKQMVEETGCTDIALIGDNIGDYGEDIKSALPEVIFFIQETINNIKFVINNISPAGYIKHYNFWLDYFCTSKIKHINIPIQSASQSLLALMNRPYSKADITEIFDLFQKLNFKDFDTHVLIGYGGETDAEFHETVDFLVKYKPKYVLASKYMPSPNDEHSHFGTVPDEIKDKRCQELANIMHEHGIIVNVEGGSIMRERGYCSAGCADTGA